MARHWYAQPVENQQCVTTAFFLFDVDMGVLSSIPELL